MAGIVLGAIGSYFGGPIGYFLGSTIGNMLDPQKITNYGPKLDDKKVMTSTYGNTLPIIYKTMRTAGNMIFSTEIQETEHSDGGKGGPQVTNVTYTYSQTMAIAICEGPITGIRKIWANGKLIYNSGSTQSSTILASHQISDGITFYNGSEDQLPDPTIQSYAGIDKTPAFRGVAYVVFNNFQLQEYGNRTPNFEFEVVNDGAATYIVNNLFNLPTSFSTPAFPQFTQLFYANFPNVNPTSQLCYVCGFTSNDDYNAFKNRKIALYEIFNNVSFSLKNMGSKTMLSIPENLYDFTLVKGAKSSDDSTIVVGQTKNTLNLTYYCLFKNSALINLDFLCYTGNKDSFNYGSDSYFVSSKNNNALVMSCSNVGDKSITLLTCSNETFISSVRIDVSAYTKRIEITDDFVYVLDVNNVIKKYDYDLNLLAIIYTPVASDIIFTIAAGDSNKLYMLYNNGSVLQNYQIIEISSGTKNVITRLPDGVALDVHGFFYQKDLYFSLVNSPTVNFKGQLISQTLSDNDVLLSNVVSDLVIRSGLTTNDFDVTSLVNEKIDGYLIGSRMSFRAALEPLMNAYFFDSIESDGKVKFIKRGGKIAANIPEDDLSASSYGSTLPDQLNTNRKQSLDLPNEITVEYSDIDADYQVGTQYSRRLIVETVNANTIQLPMAFTANKAKQICDTLLYSYYQERTSFSLKISNKYLYLDPTDIVNVTKNGTTYSIRLSESDYQNGILSYSGVEEDITVYKQNRVGSSLPAVKQEISLVTPTNLQLLDIPILRDQDDKIGYYLAASGYVDGWDGCQVYKSTDNGASFTPFGSIVKKESVIGSSLNVLGNFYTGNIFDELNSVTVLTNKPLSSLTELAVLNGGNLALLGNEVIQFKNAVLVGTNRYKITGILRGKYGTEWSMGNHTIGERFVMLDPKTVYIEDSNSSEYGLERQYAGVTFGQLLNDANFVNFTNNAVAQRPYAPVQVGGGRDSQGNVTLKWTRRTRVGGSWNNFTDVQLGESLEVYSVDILNSSGNVVRTIESITNPTTVYTSAQQTADFGSVQNVVNYKVYQISSIIGRGYAGSAVV